MKLVTNDYGCGTSSSILDYGIKDVIIVSEKNFEHVFDEEDDLFFIGHDFLFYLWDNEEKLSKWITRSKKYEHWLWCFERIDAIFPIWKQKSYISLNFATKFCNRIFASDEDDCDIHNFEWLPQWASCRFYDLRETKPEFDYTLFSGQAGKVEYESRTKLLADIQKDDFLKNKFQVTNITRSLSWEDYIKNFLKYPAILNPIGTLKALNTRAYETIYSGRTLFQQTIGNYSRHQELLKNQENVIFFTDKEDLKQKLKEKLPYSISLQSGYTNHSLYTRMKSIGIDIK
jgi:hypothetical protein